MNLILRKILNFIRTLSEVLKKKKIKKLITDLTTESHFYINTSIIINYQ